jgi:MoaA/NifB/PqqE/SkfB family radical SAM enzyme
MNRPIPRLDLMITYSCNISCVGCISLSDFKRNGVAPYSDIEQWVNHWSQLVTPRVITLFGGEPCLHPRLLDICQLVRTAWPNATIRLITNGYLLNRFPGDSWFDFAPFEMQVSVHRFDHEAVINKEIKRILSHRRDWQVSQDNENYEHRQLTWSVDDFKIFKSVFKDFVVPFKYTDKIEPWYSSAEQAHKICGAPNTPILYKGKLYKCPAVANAMDLTGENWFNYKPCEGEQDIDEFISNINKPESVCGQCPDSTQAVIIDHFNKDNVTVKQNIS